MPQGQSNKEKLETARELIADVYESLATDEKHDNGRLDLLNQILKILNDIIFSIKE